MELERGWRCLVTPAIASAPSLSLPAVRHRSCRHHCQQLPSGRSQRAHAPDPTLAASTQTAPKTARPGAATTNTVALAATASTSPSTAAAACQVSPQLGRPLGGQLARMPAMAAMPIGRLLDQNVAGDLARLLNPPTHLPHPTPPSLSCFTSGPPPSWETRIMPVRPRARRQDVVVSAVGDVLPPASAAVCRLWCNTTPRCLPAPAPAGFDYTGGPWQTLMGGPGTYTLYTDARGVRLDAHVVAGGASGRALLIGGMVLTRGGVGASASPARVGGQWLLNVLAQGRKVLPAAPATLGTNITVHATPVKGGRPVGAIFTLPYLTVRVEQRAPFKLQHVSEAGEEMEWHVPVNSPQMPCAATETSAAPPALHHPPLGPPSSAQLADSTYPNWLDVPCLQRLSMRCKPALC